MTIESVVPTEEGGENTRRRSMKEILDSTSASPANLDREADDVMGIDSPTEIPEEELKLQTDFVQAGDEPESLLDEVLEAGDEPEEDDSTETILGVVEDDGPTAQPEKKGKAKALTIRPRGPGIMSSAHHGIQKGRALMIQAFGKDEESQRMAMEALQEKLEIEYLKSMSEANAQKAQALDDEVKQVNSLLKIVTGDRNISISSIYNANRKSDPGNYPPLNSREGFMRAMLLLGDLADEVFTAPVIHSERADAKAQMALIPIRTELALARITSENQLNEAELNRGKTLRSLAIQKGSIRSEKWKSVLVPVASTVTEIPGLALINFLRVPVDKFDEWVEESDDKMKPVSSLGGAIFGAVYTMPGGPFAMLIGGVLGALGGYGAWIVLKLGAETINDWVKKQWAAVEAKVKAKQDQSGSGAPNTRYRTPGGK